MRLFSLAALVAVMTAASAAHAVEPSPPDAGAAPITPDPLLVPAPSRGLAVLAVGDVTTSAWLLARAIYGRQGLRPSLVDEAHARVLAGEPPPAGASKDLVDLAETRAAIHGDDAPSRQLLASITTSFHLRGIVVVMSSPPATPQARVFVADSSAFDAARYAPDAGDAGDVDWSGAVSSLDRTYGPAAPPTYLPPPVPSSNPAPSLATQPLPRERENKEKDAPSRPFYTSPWFWGAIGAAALAGTGLYFATRDNTPSTIHLQLQVPK